ncbi:hypothetical protein F1188_08930 [Roseospira marina]|uniref:Uncharacterized protein n=1 Tax=Roseospira marina TaxID=140057 RepID=A0A5M6IDA2_9PROT|nr:hypothetical protein [Roseospira marina]KAA5605739.1 hypothetical protein F1188_08930 [Roseospira marina]MBB4313541.1 hypothetical protein [Roseospira marina]MBB5086703.1 hypothetical protein [Roseospira marina]
MGAWGHRRIPWAQVRGAAAALLVSIAVFGCDDLEAADLTACLTAAYGAEAVVRLDDVNTRVFLVWPEDRPLETPDVVAFLRQAETCLGADPDWAGAYSISLFAKRKFAGYKTEPEMRPFVKAGAWPAAYLAEFDRAAGTLRYYPARTPAQGGRLVDLSQTLADW